MENWTSPWNEGCLLPNFIAVFRMDQDEGLLLDRKSYEVAKGILIFPQSIETEDKNDEVDDPSIAINLSTCATKNENFRN